jgi:hypothetical protein
VEDVAYFRGGVLRERDQGVIKGKGVAAIREAIFH